MREARLATAARLRKTVSQQGMAELLAPIVKRPVHQPQVSSWEAESEPPLDVIAAYATLSGLSREYLAWGDGGQDEAVRNGKRLPKIDPRAGQVAKGLPSKKKEGGAGG